jgi:hypothetical protein
MITAILLDNGVCHKNRIFGTAPRGFHKVRRFDEKKDGASGRQFDRTVGNLRDLPPVI